MKKRVLLIVLVVSIIFGLAAVSQAADQALAIDNNYDVEVAPGQYTQYRNGYLPESDKFATDMMVVELPLQPTAGTSIVGRWINVSIDLGTAESSPYVLNNYDKSVKMFERNGKEAFLARFDLQLLPVNARYAGTYPVTITAQYVVTDPSTGLEVTQSQDFTVNTRVLTGIPPEPSATPEPTMTPSVPKPEAKMMLSNYEISPNPVYAGEEFTAVCTLENTSKTESMKNIVVKYTSQSKDFVPVDGKSSVYIDKIDAGATTTVSFKMNIRADGDAGPQAIAIEATYEDSELKALSMSGEITVQVRQKIRLEHEKPKFATQVYEGDTIPATLKLLNKGKNTLYNVSVAVDIPGVTPESDSFLGNMDSGASKTAEIYCTVNSSGANSGMIEEELTTEGGMAGAMAKDGDAGSAAAADGAATDGTGVAEEENTAGNAPVYGPVEGNFVVTYEDEYGEQLELKIPIKTNIQAMQPVPDVMPDVPMEEEPQGMPLWGWIAIAAGAAVVVIIIVVRVRKKKRAQELEDIDDDELY